MINGCMWDSNNFRTNISDDRLLDDRLAVYNMSSWIQSHILMKTLDWVDNLVLIIKMSNKNVPHYEGAGPSDEQQLPIGLLGLGEQFTALGSE